METMTDLEVMDKYIEDCRPFINPKLFREVQSRGLYDYINKLPHDEKEAKAVLRARLRNDNRFSSNPEIDEIAEIIRRIDTLKEKLNNTPSTEVDITIPLYEGIIVLSKKVANYYKNKG